MGDTTHDLHLKNLTEEEQAVLAAATSSILKTMRAVRAGGKHAPFDWLGETSTRQALKCASHANRAVQQLVGEMPRPGAGDPPAEDHAALALTRGALLKALEVERGTPPLAHDGPGQKLAYIRAQMEDEAPAPARPTHESDEPKDDQAADLDDVELTEQGEADAEAFARSVIGNGWPATSDTADAEGPAEPEAGAWFEVTQAHDPIAKGECLRVEKIAKTQALIVFKREGITEPWECDRADWAALRPRKLNPET